MDLQECREKLDQIDRRLVELFEQRMKVCGEVAEYKAATGKAVYDGERERQKLDAVSALAGGNFNRQAVRELFSQLMAVSRRYQYEKLSAVRKPGTLGFELVEELPLKNVRVAYQGVEGAYGHNAALQYFGSEAELYHVSSFEEVMKEVQDGRADYAVLPIENSCAGMVTDNYDLLAKYRCCIVGEILLPVRHALLAGQDAEISDIRTVYSHLQALTQCSEYLNGHKEWKQISFANTAMAAEKVLRDKDRTQAAVASETAARLYGLKILEESIQNNQNNTTRFLVLSGKQMFCRDASKISLCFELPHQCGTLYHVLGSFMFNQVNMFMIASRPIPEKSWEYRFFADVEGNLQDAAVQSALESVGAEARNLRILGNY